MPERALRLNCGVFGSETKGSSPSEGGGESMDGVGLSSVMNSCRRGLQR